MKAWVIESSDNGGPWTRTRPSTDEQATWQAFMKLLRIEDPYSGWDFRFREVELEEEA